MNLYATLSPWDEDRGRFKAIGLADEVRRPAWCRRGDEENGKEGRRRVMPVAMPGIRSNGETRTGSRGEGAVEQKGARGT